MIKKVFYLNVPFNLLCKKSKIIYEIFAEWPEIGSDGFSKASTVWHRFCIHVYIKNMVLGILFVLAIVL